MTKFQLDAIDRMLRDIIGNRQTPFGAKVLVIMGQLVQALCVVPGATEGEVQRMCLFSHPELWPLVHRYTFIHNMRASANSTDIVTG